MKDTQLKAMMSLAIKKGYFEDAMKIAPPLYAITIVHPIYGGESKRIMINIFPINSLNLSTKKLNFVPNWYFRRI